MTHTAYAYSARWWVDLGSVQHIGQINLYNRTDCCSSRLSHYQILVSADSTDGFDGSWPLVVEQSGTVIPDDDPWPAKLHPVNTWARWVTVVILTEPNFLSLAEVQVFPY